MESLGLLAIVGLLLVKEVGFPVPVPGDLVVVGAGIAASRGAFDPALGLVLIVVAGIAGGIVQFLLIRGAGRRFLLPLLARVGVGADRLDPAADRLRSRGATGVAVARATPGVRIVAIAASALAALPLPAFAAGLAVGNTTFVSAHYVLGLVAGEAAVPLAGSVAGVLAVAVVGMAIVGAAGWLLIARRRRSRGVPVSLPPLAAWVDAACPACLTAGLLDRQEAAREPA